MSNLKEKATVLRRTTAFALLIVLLIGVFGYGIYMQIRAASCQQMYEWSLESQGTQILFLSGFVDELIEREINDPDLVERLEAMRFGNEHLRESLLEQMELHFDERNFPDVYYRIREEYPIE